MTTAPDLAALSPEDQYALVYQGICAVASNCDGAITEDGVGFNGQDTHFGRRIASVPFESWTEDVKVEAARISLTYKQQILSYTGIDMFELPVVKEASGHGTNRKARDDARAYERRAAKADLINDRRVRSIPEKRAFAFFWAKGDPDFRDMLAEAKALPGRWFDWNTTENVVEMTPDAIAFAAKWGFELSKEEAAKVAAAPKAERVHGYMISDEAVFQFNGVSNWGEVKGAIKEAGARFEPSDKSWRVKVTSARAAAVVAAARRVGLNVAKEVDVAIGAGQQAVEVEIDRGALLLAASKTSRPTDVSPEFLALVQAAVAR